MYLTSSNDLLADIMYENNMTQETLENLESLRNALEDGELLCEYVQNDNYFNYEGEMLTDEEVEKIAGKAHDYVLAKIKELEESAQNEDEE